MPKTLPKKLPQSPNSDYHYLNLAETNRIQRSISFVNMARSIAYLPLKISLYCSALECLFSTSTSEINFKITQRSAIYLAGSYDAIKTNFETVKDAYDIRSTFFHGSAPSRPAKSSMEALADISKNLDEVVRKILTKAILHDSAMFLNSKFKDVVTAYFNEIIFKNNWEGKPE